MSGATGEVYAVFGFRNGAEHPFKERLEKLAAEHANLHLQISYSAPRTSDVQHKDYIHTRPADDRPVTRSAAVEQLSILRVRPRTTDGNAGAGIVGVGRARFARAIRGVRPRERAQRRLDATTRRGSMRSAFRADQLRSHVG